MVKKITCEQLLNASNNAIIATDTAGKICFLNAQAQKIFQNIEGLQVDRSICDFLPISGALALKCLKSGRPQLGQHILGNQVRLVVNITPIKVKGQLQGAMCSFQEMQQFEKAALQLESYKQLNKELETIFDASSDGIWVYDGNGKVIAVNRAGEKLDDVAAKNVIGKSVFDLIANGVFDGVVVTEVLRTKRQVTNISRSPKKNRDYLCTGTPVLDDSGDITLVIVNQRDMRELNALKRMLEDAQMVAEKSQSELTALNLQELRDNQIIAKSEAYKEVLKVAIKLAQTGVSNILILGETGTGKGLLAKLIHAKSVRKDKPFIAINCAALPDTLLEAELFGYEKGAFTGARDQGKAGLFELAHQGTLFLDEIGDLPYAVQAKLLKYLDDNEIMRLGGTNSRKLNCSIIAATNRNLEKLLAKKEFRKDLFFRLNTFMIKIPNLNERPEDISALVEYFLHKYNRQYNQTRKITLRQLERFQNYPFPGNVRELKNIIKRAVVMSEKNKINDCVLETGRQLASCGTNLPLKEQLETIEKQILFETMQKHKTTRAISKHLRLNQSSVVRKLQKYGLTASAI